MQLHHITLLIGVLTKNNLLINLFLIWKNLADIVGDCFAEKVAWNNSEEAISRRFYVLRETGRQLIWYVLPPVSSVLWDCCNLGFWVAKLGKSKGLYYICIIYKFFSHSPWEIELLYRWSKLHIDKDICKYGTVGTPELLPSMLSRMYFHPVRCIFSDFFFLGLINVPLSDFLLSQLARTDYSRQRERNSRCLRKVQVSPADVSTWKRAPDKQSE